MGLSRQEKPGLGNSPRPITFFVMGQGVGEETGPASALAPALGAAEARLGLGWGGGSSVPWQSGALARKSQLEPPEGFSPPCSGSVPQGHAPAILMVSWPQTSPTPSIAWQPDLVSPGQTPGGGLLPSAWSSPAAHDHPEPVTIGSL